MATEAQKLLARKELARRELARRESERLSRESFGEPVVEDDQFQVGGDVTVPISDIFPGVSSVVERTANLMTATAAEPIAGIAGLAQSLNPLAPEGAGAETVEQVREALTFDPRSEQAQVDQVAFAEMMRPVAEWIDKARMGDEALEAGMPPAVAAAYEAFPEAVGGMLAIAGLPSVRGTLAPSAPTRIKPKNAEQIADIMTGKEPAARFKLAGQSVKKNRLGRDAISRGWDELAVAKVSSLKGSEKPIYQRMVNKAKDYFREFSPSGRPSDVVGTEVAKRLRYLADLKETNGKRLNKIVNGPMGRKQVDIDDFVGEFLQDMSELGGRFDRNGKLVFSTESRLFQQPGNQKALSGLFERLKISGNPTAKQIHETKQWIDEFIDYGKSPTKTDAGISKTVERLLKGYRGKLNDKLRVDEKYARANDIFSDAAGALTDMQKAIGPSVDILDDPAFKAIGQKMRTFLSNNANRVKVEAAVGEMQAIANKWGGKFPDHDIAAQMKFINEMERLWGAFTDTSFKAEIGQAGQRVAETPSVAQVGREGVRLTGRQLQKIHRARDKQLRAIERLLK